MAYIYLNKEDNSLRVFGSVTAMCKATNINLNKIYNVFGRKGLKELENEYYRILNTKIERA
jgi:hypothetical protein